MAKAKNVECRDIFELCRDKSSRQPVEVCRNNQIFVAAKIMKIAQKNNGRMVQHFTAMHDINCEEGIKNIAIILKLCRCTIPVVTFFFRFYFVKIVGRKTLSQ